MFHFIADVRALKDMHIKVPEAVKVGESVTLACDYDLESVALYTIKWYRYDEEFYRYVPKESPPSKVFAMPHLNVDVSNFDFISSVRSLLLYVFNIGRVVNNGT